MTDLDDIIMSEETKKILSISIEKTDEFDIIKIENQNTQKIDFVYVDKQCGYITEIAYNKKKQWIEYQYTKTIRNIKKNKITQEKIFKFKIDNGIHYRNSSNKTGWGWIKKCEKNGCPQVTRSHSINLCIKHSGETIRKEINKNKQNVKKSKCADIGEETELYIENLLKSLDDVENIERVGRTGSIFDILYNFKNDVRRGIQIKTLTETEYVDNYYFVNSKETYDDLLFICINKTKDRFVVMFARDFGSKKVTTSIPFTSKKTKYSKFMFKEYNEFIDQLCKDMRESTIVTDDILIKSIPYQNQKEYLSLRRLEKICELKNIKFEYCHNQNKQYDIIINGFKIQCKTTSRKSGYRYYCHIGKCVKINGKDTKIPYNENDDFDIVAIEILTNLNNFYFIPKKELLEHDKLTTKTNKGKVDMSILDRDDKKNHSLEDWTDKYYNNFKVLKSIKKLN